MTSVGLGAAVLILAGCGDENSMGSKSEPFVSGDEAVGDPCEGAPVGFVDVNSPNVDLAAIDEARFSTSFSSSFGWNGYVSLGASVAEAGSCGCCTINQPVLSFRLDEEHLFLGEHELNPDVVNLWLTDDIEVQAPTGAVTFTGYDPNTGSLCGSVTAEFEDYGTITATFSAYDVCPPPT